MRKVLALMTVSAVAVAVGVASLASAAGPGIQTIDATLTPTKLDKKKYSPAKIFVDIATQSNDEHTNPLGPQPPNAVRTIVDFPTNMKFDTGAVPNCKVSADKLDGTSTDEATDLCGKDSKVSIDSGTSAVVTIAGAGDVPVVVTAFNGNKPNTLYLHARVNDFGITSILTGKLVKGPNGYGSSLDVTIPPLAAGAISDFKTTVEAGKYVQTRCKSKTNNFQARTTFEDDPNTATTNEGHTPTVATDSTTCKQKKPKKGGKK